MPRTLIRNTTSGPMGLPFPYHHVLGPGRSGVVDGDRAAVIASLGGAAQTMTGLEIRMVNPAEPVTIPTIGPAMMPNGSVTSDELADGSVTPSKLAAAAVTANAIAPDAVGSGAIAAGAVGTGELENGSVTSGKLAPGAVDQTALGPGAVVAAKLGAGAVGAAALGMYVSPEQVGNGAEQVVAHGLGAAPSVAFPVLTGAPTVYLALTISLGTIDTTNLRATLGLGWRYRWIAFR